MAVDLTGIYNENEFYTHHYLSVILENDLKNLFSNWHKMEEKKRVKPPHLKLAGMAKEYFALRGQMEKAKACEAILPLQHKFFASFFEALGYNYGPCVKELDTGFFLPLIAEVKSSNGAPKLWIIETLCPVDEGIDPLLLNFAPCQYHPDSEGDKMLCDDPLAEVITKQVFSLGEPPRWVIIYNFFQIVLLDRSKWNEKRLLRLDLPEIFSRREVSALRAMAAFFHKDSTCPEDTVSLLDTLDENSHRHAFAVSEDLKYSLREAVELLGNEAIYYLRNIRKGGIYGKEYSEELTRECLRYLYRLLFLFYIEARREIEYAPMKSEEYRTGYSLESLRDLEIVSLTTEEAKNGFFIHESLKVLFHLVFNGFKVEEFKATQRRLAPEKESIYHSFRLAPLMSHLFDPDRTLLLNRVKFRNFVWQKVLELLSLSRPKGTNHGRGQKRKSQRRGRISYAQLGINQLGAVYEGLLSYSGFFAETDLYEVKRAKDDYNELDTAFFVEAEDLTKYEKDEKVYNPDGTLKMYSKGSFIYRMHGRNRQKSASYYTPEILTRCLIKYALKDLLKDKCAEDILKITVCEPALGSGAFLNEAINQLAENYLQRKQKEIKSSISHENYAREKQKVKAYIAAHNVYGVDLNPIAVELAEVSLWLNTIYSGARVPWFGMQLAVGNSLIGARRQVFPAHLLEKNRKGKESWLDVVPERVRLGETRPSRTGYHFLLPDTGMANYTDKVVKDMAGEKLETMKQWRSSFMQPFDAGDIDTLLRLSAAIDRLWERHREKRQRVREENRDAFSIFGHELDVKDRARPIRTTQEKDKIFNRKLLSKNMHGSSPYRRLKLVMDYWCALWFWPIDKAHLLPSRDEYLMDLSLLLEGDVVDTAPTDGRQFILFPQRAPKQLNLVDESGSVNVDHLVENIDRLKVVVDLSEKYHFHHWELEFVDLFAERGGFDLVVGNPPWIKVQWNEGGIMGDYEPLYVIRKYSAARMNELREETVNRCGIRDEYLSEYEEFTATQNFLGGYQNYPHLKGTQTNLYKCFLPQAWYVIIDNGFCGFLHPEGVYDDPNGGRLREQIYKRLRCHFQFQNELRLFDIDHHVKFSINIYSNTYAPTFSHISNLFHPSTIDQIYNHDGAGICEGIKDENNNWSIRGHKDRIIELDSNTLALLSKLYDSGEIPAYQARLPAVHSRPIVEVLRKFITQSKRLCSLSEYFSTQMWHETNAQKDGTIKRSPKFPTNPVEIIFSGPHFYVGNPLYKTPRTICRQNADYDVLDLRQIPDGYLPRTNYLPACDSVSYYNRIPRVPWKDNEPVTNFYRLLFRGMLPPTNEHTLIGAIMPKEVGHINGCISYSFHPSNLKEFVIFGVYTFSLLFDFMVKSTGRTNLHQMLDDFPLITNTKYDDHLIIRALLLNCLTTHYAELWEGCWNNSFTQDCWTKEDPRLNNATFTSLTLKWQRSCSLRSDFERRQALIEIDVLAWPLGSIWRSFAPFTGCSFQCFDKMKMIPGMTGTAELFSPAAKDSQG